jgi:ribokinase
MKPIHLAVGRFNIDIIVKLSEIPEVDVPLTTDLLEILPGGAATNYAVAIANLGHSSRLLAKVGNNEVVKTLMGVIAEIGVNLENVIELSENIINAALIFLRNNGKISIVRRIHEKLTLDKSEINRLAGLFDVVHYASVSPELIDRNRGNKITSYDPGPFANIVRDINIDILFVNEKEFNILKNNKNINYKYIVIKLGNKGAKLYGDSYECYVEPYSHGKVIDTTGAGDVFDAGFNYGLAEGLSIEESLAIASIAAGIKVTRLGGINSPKLNEVMSIFKSIPPRVRCK